MKLIRHTSVKASRLGRGLIWLLCSWLLIGPVKTQADDLEGLSAGSTNWIKVTLQGWNELDYVPGKVVLTGGPTNGRTVTINFNHTKGSIPQIEFLTGFWSSGNVVMTSQPVLSAPAGADVWSYSFTVNLQNNSSGTVNFYSRLAAGAHLAASSLLHFSTKALQINTPVASPGSPDLAIAKSGPATCLPGGVMTYTLNYTNNSGCAATGVQVTDILPGQVTFVSGGPSCQLGNTLTWDLGAIPSGASGTLTYQVQVGTNVPAGQSFGGTAMILSAQNDANSTNNSSAVTTTVQALPVPAITANPVAVTNSSGGQAVFSAAASGGLLSFQWRKNGTAIPGATQSTYVIASAFNADVANYDVVVTNASGSAVSSAVPLVLYQPLSAGQMLPNQTFQINADALSNRKYEVQYSSDLTHWKTAETGIICGGSVLQWTDCGAPKTDCAPAAVATRYYRVLLLP